MARELGTGFTYQAVEILHREELGSGSYGAVYKAKCDELLCAAKILHPILLLNMDMEPERVRERFEQECRFLSDIKHPNIVQFLGTTFQPNGAIVLLMELMDESLTHFLEASPREPIEYYLQITLCYDVALALAYLHSNNIVHRDLSSNNVLLLARARAKVTDFGVSKMIPPNHRRSGPSLSVCPGTPHYMPPEALDDDSTRLSHNAYNTKLDCFSYGVLCIQIITRRYPSPGGRIRRRVIAGGTMVRALVGEVERRINDIDRVPADNELRGVFMECLSDECADRPTTQEICHRLVLIKQGDLYNASVQNRSRVPDGGDGTQAVEQQYTADLERQFEVQEQQMGDLRTELETREIEIRECRGQITRKNRFIEERNEIISRKEQEVSNLDTEIQELRILLQRRETELNTKDRNLQRMRIENEELEQLCTNQQVSLDRKEKTIRDLNREIEHKDRALVIQRQASKDERINLNWKLENPAPKLMRRSPDGVLGNNIVYLKYFWGKHLWSYNLATLIWTELPECPNSSFSLAVINTHPTIIGGKQPSLQPSDILYSLIDDPPMWSDALYPPMPTKRYWTMAACYGSYLIVVGGEGLGHTRLTAVEVLDLELLQWWVAAKLPLTIDSASVVISTNFFYMGSGSDGTSHSFVFCCLDDLLTTLKCPLTGEYKTKDVQIAKRVWKKGANTPLATCSLACVSSCVLAVGGWDDKVNQPSASVFTYISDANMWLELEPMQIARSACFAVTVLDDRLLVVGGNIDERSATDQVEVASVSK